ncbi:hypothetical protein NU195Hw_Modified_80t1 [Hortaea werneckii]
MSIPLLPELPITDPATSTIHDFLTNLSLSRTPLQIPASLYNNTAGASGGRVGSGTLYIFPERTFRLLQAVMIACFTMLCLLSWLAAFLTTRKAGMLAVELGIWKGMKGWAERRRAVEMRGKMGGEEGRSSRGPGGFNGQGEMDGDKRGAKKMEGTFLDRILLRFLLLQTQSPTLQDRANVHRRDGGSHEDRFQQHGDLHHHHHRSSQPPPLPPTHLPTLPTLLITLLSLTKHIPLILCTSAPGNEILRWFIHLPEYAGVIIFMHGVWSLGAVVGVWVLLLWRGVRGRGKGEGGGCEEGRGGVGGLDGVVEGCGRERGRGRVERGRGRAGGRAGWVVEVGMVV